MAGIVGEKKLLSCNTFLLTFPRSIAIGMRLLWQGKRIGDRPSVRLVCLAFAQFAIIIFTELECCAVGGDGFFPLRGWHFVRA